MMAQLCAQTFADCRRSSRSGRSGKDFRAFALERLSDCHPFHPFLRARLGKHSGCELAPHSQPIRKE